MKGLQRAFTDQTSRSFFVLNDFLAIVTIVSIVTIVLETVPVLAKYGYVFNVVEWIAVIIFSLEYIARTVISRPWYQYPTSFFGYIDLISIIPSILGLGNFTWLKSARTVRIIRLLRIMRLTKMRRARLLPDDLGVLSCNVLIYFSTLIVALLASGTLMYVVEAPSETFTSIPASMWWSMKVFLASIPVPEPATQLGEALYVITRFIGLLLLGLLVGVTGTISRSYLKA